MRLLALALLACVAAAEPWPQYYGGPTHANHRPNLKDSIVWPKVAWHFAGAIGQPAVRGRYVYAGGPSLYCLDAETGKLVAAHGDGNIRFAPAPVAIGELVIARRFDHSVVALTPRLEAVAWRFVRRARLTWPYPAAYADGTYVFTQDFEVIALHAATGALIWTIAPDGGPVDVSPAIDDGRVYVGTHGGAFVCLDLRTGHELWRHESGRKYSTTHPVVAFGKVFVGDRGVQKVVRPSFNAFDARTGQELWSVPFGATGFATPGIGPDGRLLCGFGRTLAQFDAATGKRVHEHDIRTGINPFGSPTLVDGTIYFGNLDGHLYAHDAKTKALKWAFQVDGQVSDFVHTGKYIYVATTKGLYALTQDEQHKDKPPRGYVLKAN